MGTAWADWEENKYMDPYKQEQKIPFNIEKLSESYSGWDQLREKTFDSVQIDLARRVSVLENEINKLKNFIKISSITINTLGNDRWELKQQLTVSIEQRGADEFIACLYDMDLYGYGENIPEAIEDLKVVIVNQFEYLNSNDDGIELSRYLQKQLRTLKSIVVGVDA